MWQRIDLSGKGPREIAVHGQIAYVAQFYSDSIAVVELGDDKVPCVRTIPLGPAPELTLERKGQLLFDDASICYLKWQSCASCHPDGRADALNWDLMNDGVGNPKNSKSMVASHQTPPAMIKGVRATAEVAVRSGLTHILFTDRPEEEALAIDAYLKSLKPIPSPHLENGELSAKAERGKKLFHSKRVACARCHPAPLFTDMRIHRMGRTPSRYFPNLFDTPTLLEVWRTAPYLHDGQYSTVKELLLEGRHGLRQNMGLSDSEAEDLAEYVLSL
jgi:cytochrome c peroxidase